jgi:PAS domain S-box-containing protein
MHMTASDSRAESPQLASLRAVALTSPRPLVIIDRCGRVILWNPAATRLFGWAEAELLGTALPFTEGESGTGLRAISDGDQPHGIEARLRRRDGTTVHALIERTELLDGEGRTFAVALGISDLGEHHQAGRILRESNRRAIMSRLTRGIAHDFNNALTLIQCNIEMATEDLAAAGIDTARLDEAFDATRSATALARRLFLLSRSRGGRPRAVDLSTAVDEVIHVLRRSVPELVEIVITHEPELHRTEVDPGDLENVLADLLLRACDAMPTGGVIRIECANATVATAEQHGDAVLPAGEYASVSIIDTRHVGATPPTSTERVPGIIFDTEHTGEFGIAGTLECARLAGGHLVVRTMPGYPTHFKLYLPRLEQFAA